MHIYIAGGFMATVRQDKCQALDDLHDELAEAPIHDEEALVYRVLDGLTDAFYPVIEALEHDIDQLEAEVLSRPRKEHLTRTYRLKQDVRELHRLTAAQRDQFQAAHVSILGLEGFAKGTKPYLRDIGDHLTQITSEFGRQAEDLFSLTQTYFNANADRLNAVASRLTVGGTIFIVWTVVTGFFGQNFGFLVDNIDSREKFLILGVGGLVIPTVILLTLFWVKRHDWFWGGYTLRPCPSTSARSPRSTSSPASSPRRWPRGSSAPSARASRPRPSSWRRWRYRSRRRSR